ncbi:hypothetical protein [Azovibrio restrictus]|uniref:hypothetical protein n=1 Tax=Azovibrio restrictus TaxID=146938 RepID=UPI0026EDCD50|nr:hypothetical protein [Azovibrio restrictus]MDD3483172.1 hypothetical protein [Azovibrio restrictus]
MDNNFCYCCDKPAIGQGDHVPPMALFPKGSFSNTKPIIVPSCAEHNQKISKADEYLKFILAASSKSAPTAVIKSTVRGIVRHIKNNSKCLPKFGVKGKGKKALLNESIPVNLELLNKALEKIARGIYFHQSGGKKSFLATWMLSLFSLELIPEQARRRENA